MPTENTTTWTRTELTTKLRSSRKKIKKLEAKVDRLETQVGRVEGTNMTLMHNLKIVMRQLKLKPQSPKK